jgi:hypothetical protein
MATEISTEDAVRPVSAEETVRIGRPVELLEIEENGVPEEISYPSGHKLWLTVASLCVTMFLKGLVRLSNVIRAD